MRRRFLPGLLGAMTLLAAGLTLPPSRVTGHPAAAAEAPSKTPDDVMLVFSGETNGYLKPCGCVSFQLGGLPRRVAHWQHVTEGLANTISADNGHLFEGPGKQNEMEANVIAQVYSMMKYRIVNFTDRDQAFGGQYLLDYWAGVPKVMFVSANYRPKEWEGKIKGHIIQEFTVGGKPYRVAFTGAFDPKVMQAGADFAPKVLLSPEEGIAKVLPAMNDANLRVLLFMGRIQSAIELAKKFPGLDVIVTGYEEDMPDEEPVMQGKTMIIKTGHRGKYLSTVRVVGPGPSQSLEYAREEITERYGEDPLVKMMIAEHVKKVSDLKLMEAKAESEPSPGGNYLGSAACGSCHKDEYEIWKSTRHGRAYNTLVKVGHQRDPECIGCHVVGFPMKSGFVNEEETPHLIDVGCENCHGPGQNHIMDSKKPYRNMDLSKCVTCHYDEHDPGFHPEKWELIKHGPKYNAPMLKKIMEEKAKGKPEADSHSGY